MKTKTVKIGSKVIGGGNPILIQSMTNTKTEDVEATVAQILELEAAGCDIIRKCRFLKLRWVNFVKQTKNSRINKKILKLLL